VSRGESDRPGFVAVRSTVDAADVLEKDEFRSRVVERRVGTSHAARRTPGHLGGPMSGRSLGRRRRARPLDPAAAAGRPSPGPVVRGPVSGAAPRHPDLDGDLLVLVGACAEVAESGGKHGVGQRWTEHYRVRTVLRLGHSPRHVHPELL